MRVLQHPGNISIMTWHECSHSEHNVLLTASMHTPPLMNAKHRAVVYGSNSHCQAAIAFGHRLHPKDGRACSQWTKQWMRYSTTYCLFIDVKLRQGVIVVYYSLVKVTRSVIWTKGDLQYLDIFKPFLGLPHRSSETMIPLPTNIQTSQVSYSLRLNTSKSFCLRIIMLFVLLLHGRCFSFG